MPPTPPRGHKDTTKGQQHTATPLTAKMTTQETLQNTAFLQSPSVNLGQQW
ncbi:hypothetical protein FF011L_16110 [Roseimaritima multifibrata]|uniref:Uncharacterized protein n=1 Tax=Roseimaritima multifibrata TaxID=1930274 RepID=A0A517MDA2_9BACT|nr:hypothetical protein FF011L_16110 [Roseimaritima multifibrata]